MVRATLIFTLFLTSFSLFAQDESVIRYGLLRAQGTISFGSFADLDQNGLYLHGNLEYYTNNKVSARGDLYFYLKPNDQSELELNHQLFSGASFHINTNSNFNPYIGIQPGLSLTQLSELDDSDILNINYPDNSVLASPLLSGVFGFNFYANNWFHLFADARYVYGNHLSKLGSVSITEFRFSFGLGFNLNTK